MAEDLLLEVSEGEAPARRPRGRLYRKLLFAVVCFAGGAVFWHFGLENSRRYTVYQQEGRLLVDKGVPFPTGSLRYQGGPAYEPLELPPGTKVEQQQATSLVELDTLLLELYLRLARETLQPPAEAGAATPPVAERLPRARTFLKRAKQLSHLDATQEELLLRTEGDLDLTGGLELLRPVVFDLGQALQLLELAERKGTTRQPPASLWADWLRSELAEYRAALATGAPPRGALASSPPPGASPPGLPSAPPTAPAAPAVPPEAPAATSPEAPAAAPPDAAPPPAVTAPAAPAAPTAPPALSPGSAPPAGSLPATP
ncbi:MAG: hypothetical protein RBU45_12730 [Myxococcota bacterium]|jgi:hypothetical protein|nr:hypothetical protein [Myxococcota bacterium]